MSTFSHTLDPSGSIGALGDWVCLKPDGTVTRAITSALTTYGFVYGCLVVGGNPGATVYVLTEGAVPPSISGLSALSGKARVNGSTARAERVASLSGSDYPIGDIDSSGTVEFGNEPSTVITSTQLSNIGTPKHGAVVFVEEEDNDFVFDANSTATVSATVVASSDGSRGRWVSGYVTSIVAGPGVSVSGVGSVTVSADPQPLQVDLTSVGNASGRTGVYTSALMTYASSIDSSLTTLSAYVKYDNGCSAAALAAGTKLPVLLLLHGYSQDASETYITQAMKERGADHGFFVIAPHQRGRGGNPGTADDCRDVMDTEDAITAAAATYPTIVDPTRVFEIGYSGGGAVVLQRKTKLPGRSIGSVSFFNWGDYGVDIRPGKSAWGAFVGRATIAARCGGRDNLERYRARSALENIGSAVSQSSGKLWLLWDAQDTIGVCLRTVRDALLESGAPVTKWASSESDTGDTVRWTHGYPDNPSADLKLAENLIYRMVGESAPTVQHSGNYQVAGYVVHAAGFEVWTAATSTATTNAKTHSTGGQSHSVDVQFDVDSMQYRVTPRSGTCIVTVIQGRRRLTKTVSATTTFDLANSLEAIIPDAKHVVDMARGVVLSGSNITSVADQITGGTLVPPSTAIVWDDADNAYPAAKFVGTGDNLRGDTLSLLSAHEDFEIAVCARATLGQSTQTIVAYADGTVNQFITIFVDDTTVYGGIEGTSQSAQATFNLYPHSSGTPGVASYYNIYFLSRVGSTLSLRVNAETVVGTATIPNPTNACAATRLSIGSLDRSPGASEIRPLVGAFRGMVSVVGRALTSQERADLYDHWYQCGEFRAIAG